MTPATDVRKSMTLGEGGTALAFVALAVNAIFIAANAHAPNTPSLPPRRQRATVAATSTALSGKRRRADSTAPNTTACASRRSPRY